MSARSNCSEGTGVDEFGYAARTPWQPCVSAKWREQQLKHSFLITLGKMLQNDPTESEDVEVPYLKAQHVQWDEIRVSDLPRMWASPAEIDALQLRKGDLLVCEGGDVGRSAILRSLPQDLTIIQNALHVVRGRNGADPRFLAYVLRHAAYQGWFEVVCNRSTIRHFTVEKFGEMRAWLPDAPEQRAIADYLDRETARLDALVAEKERLLDLLAEKRRALITRAVTRGLDPNVPFRDSGIPWLGEIPAHWTQSHLKRVLASMDYGISVSVETSGNVAVLRMGDIQDGEIDYSKIGYVDEVDGALLLQPGDLVFNRTNSLDQIAKVALFRGETDYPVSFASYFVRFRCSPAVLPEFLNWLLNSAYPLAWGRAQALPATGQANLNPSRYGYLPISMPSISEQEGIVQYISNWASRIDAVRAETRQTIELLEQRRSALISAAVTGLLEVT